MEGTYQILSRDILGLLHSNIWWFQGVKLNENRFSLARAHELYLEGIYCVEDIWDSDNRTFHSWDEAQTKIHLTHTYDEDWATLTSKMNDQWRHFLEDDPDITHPNEWFGIYIDIFTNSKLVLQSSFEYTPSYLHQQ